MSVTTPRKPLKWRSQKKFRVLLPRTIYNPDASFSGHKGVAITATGAQKITDQSDVASAKEASELTDQAGEASTSYFNINSIMVASRKVQDSRILIDKLLKLILFYLTISLKLWFSRSHQ
jgi:hypothetical protein